MSLVSDLLSRVVRVAGRPLPHRLLAALPFGILVAAAPSCIARQVLPAIEHRVVYHDTKEFAGWPANEGMWAWGDELLVGFEVARYTEVDKDHSIDRSSPKRITFARSLDGGRTWLAEEHPEIAPPEYIGDAARYRQESSTAAAPQPSPGNFDFSHPDFAMKIRGGTFYVSFNRGREWSGPYLLPDFGGIPESRTNYLVTGPNTCLIFGNSRVVVGKVKYTRSCVFRTDDGGKTFQFVSWIGDDIAGDYQRERTMRGEIVDGGEEVFSIMPSAVQIGDRYVVSLRQRVGRMKWTDIYASADGCRTWKKLSRLENGSSNPAALVALGGEKLAAIYGNRRGGKTPLGVSAKLSEDGGRTWSKEIMLRSDARKWDLGYTRAVRRADGTIIAAYYYTTEAVPQNFIAATLWRPTTGETKN
ncbi:MAG: glycoside hydrolase [Candidatus Didemnitutus sp.]|nr:glycoside hydrolase [Candidatus Didemnitutus sp.]